MQNLFNAFPELQGTAAAHTVFLNNLAQGSEDINDILTEISTVKNLFLMCVKLSAYFQETPFVISGTVFSVVKKTIEDEERVEGIFLAETIDGKKMLCSLIFPAGLNTIYNGDKPAALPRTGEAFILGYSGKKQSTENKGKSYNDLFLLHK